MQAKHTFFSGFLGLFKGGERNLLKDFFNMKDEIQILKKKISFLVEQIEELEIEVNKLKSVK